MKKSTIALGLVCVSAAVIGGGYTYVANETGKAIERALANAHSVESYDRGIFSSHVVLKLQTPTGYATVDTDITHLKYNLTKHAYVQVKSQVTLAGVPSEYHVLADIGYPKNDNPYPTAENFKGNEWELDTAQKAWLINGILKSGVSVKINNPNTKPAPDNWPLSMDFALTDGGKHVSFNVADLQSPLLSIKGLQSYVELPKALAFDNQGNIPQATLINSPDYSLKAQEIDVTTLAMRLFSNNSWAWAPSTQDYYQIRDLDSYQDTDKNNLAKGKFSLALNAVQAGKIIPILTLSSTLQSVIPPALQTLELDPNWINDTPWKDPKLLASLVGTKGDGDLVISTADGKKSDLVFKWDVKKNPQLIAEGQKDVANFSVKTSLNPQQLVNIINNAFILSQDKGMPKVLSSMLVYGLNQAQEWRPQTGPILQKQGSEKDANLMGTLEFNDGEWKLNGNVIEIPPLH